ncbi:19001_t:CDS:2 [Gigaspora margarita]|uniref:19001_t:CDS:1 n=1 Tax=Gigaspora margarita TaxID=4874 RepID=A0ABN7V5C6_GIGMA|nr:19001_t:CDS:2 [Gigaspora margarita]
MTDSPNFSDYGIGFVRITDAPDFSNFPNYTDAPDFPNCNIGFI